MCKKPVGLGANRVRTVMDLGLEEITGAQSLAERRKFTLPCTDHARRGGVMHRVVARSRRGKKIACARYHEPAPPQRIATALISQPKMPPSGMCGRPWVVPTPSFSLT